MKTIQSKLAGITAVCAVALFLAAAPAQAAETAPPAGNYTFGVIDMTKVMKEPDAAQGVIKKLDEKRVEFQKKIQKQEDTLRAAEEELRKDKEKLSEEDFNKKRTDFEKKVVELQKLVQESKATLDNAFLHAMDDMRDAVKKTAAEVAKERGYGAVLTQESVIISLPAMDMTEEVIKRMNKEVKEIPLKWAKK